MKVFLSSVRRGLEEERDCLPGLIRAVGHHVLRFEDFGAQAVPSREACLRGVDECDLYLLLLGPHYGHVFPETGQSATHDEFVAARTSGKPRLVFRKTGVAFEPEQEELARHIGDYGTGAFYGTFTSAVDLQPLVVQALTAAANPPDALTYETLPVDVEVVYAPSGSDHFHRDPGLEVHVVPLDGNRRSARLMRLLPDQIASALRSSRAIAPSVGVETSASEGQVDVRVTQPARGWSDTSPSVLAGVGVTQGGQVTIRHTLPRDQMGAILAPDDVAATITGSLRLAGDLGLLTGERFAIAVDITHPRGVSEGSANGVGRSSASGFISRDELRVHPDESVSAAALDRGASEVARTLTDLLLAAFRTRR